MAISMAPQKTPKSFSITTSEVVFLFILGIFIGVLVTMIAGCGEFQNAKTHTENNLLLDSGRMVEKETGLVERKDNRDSTPANPADSGMVVGIESGSIGEVDARTYPDSSSESSTPTIEAAPEPIPETGPKYCIDCPPGPFGSKACCSAYLRCGWITSLGNCTDGHI